MRANEILKAAASRNPKERAAAFEALAPNVYPVLISSNGEILASARTLKGQIKPLTLIDDI